MNFLLDEFGNFTPISDMTNKLTVAAGRGMRYALYVQGFDQLKEKYSDNIANTIQGQLPDMGLSAKRRPGNPAGNVGQAGQLHHIQLPALGQ